MPNIVFIAYIEPVFCETFPALFEYLFVVISFRSMHIHNILLTLALLTI